jgi:Flp pilus assembly protein protease CpaA
MLLTAAVVTDLRTRRIPNRLLLLGAGAAVALDVIGWVSQVPPPARVALVHGLAGMGVGALWLLPGYLLGRTGGGDVKLLAVAGAFLGPAGVAMAGLYAMAIGGPWLLWWLWRTRRRGTKEATRPRHAPYAPAIAAGCTLSMLQSFNWA